MIVHRVFSAVLGLVLTVAGLAASDYIPSTFKGDTLLSSLQSRFRQRDSNSGAPDVLHRQTAFRPQSVPLSDCSSAVACILIYIA
jgi:hypothetical protein